MSRRQLAALESSAMLLRAKPALGLANNSPVALAATAHCLPLRRQGSTYLPAATSGESWARPLPLFSRQASL